MFQLRQSRISEACPGQLLGIKNGHPRNAEMWSAVWLGVRQSGVDFQDFHMVSLLIL